MRPIGEAAVWQDLRADMGSDGSAARGGVKRPERVAGVGKTQACCVRRSGCRGPQQDIRPYSLKLCDKSEFTDCFLFFSFEAYII